LVLCLSVAAAAIEEPPKIRRWMLEPTTHTPVVGGTATFTVEASGTPPLTFHWEFNDVPIAGATNAALQLAPLRPEDAGGYRVTVSNTFGVAVSSRMSFKPANWVLWGNEIIQKKGLPASATNLVAVSASESHTIGIRADGTALVWANADGFNIAGLLPPAGLRDVVAVAAGGGLNLALLRGGTLRAWGWNAPDLGIPPDTRDVVAIAAGGYGIAIRSDGALLVFGGRPEARRRAEGVYDAVRITSFPRVQRSDGSVLDLEENPFYNPPPPYLPPPEGVPPVAASSIGYTHGIALVDDALLASCRNPRRGRGTRRQRAVGGECLRCASAPLPVARRRLPHPRRQRHGSRTRRSLVF
jgi:hypothetical protein